MKKKSIVVEIDKGGDAPYLYIKLPSDRAYNYVKYQPRYMPKTDMVHPVLPEAVAWCKKYGIPLIEYRDGAMSEAGYYQSRNCSLFILDEDQFMEETGLNMFTSNKLNKEVSI